MHIQLVMHHHCPPSPPHPHHDPSQSTVYCKRVSDAGNVGDARTPSSPIAFPITIICHHQHHHHHHHHHHHYHPRNVRVIWYYPKILLLLPQDIFPEVRHVLDPPHPSFVWPTILGVMCQGQGRGRKINKGENKHQSASFQTSADRAQRDPWKR